MLAYYILKTGDVYLLVSYWKPVSIPKTVNHVISSHTLHFATNTHWKNKQTNKKKTQCFMFSTFDM